MLKKDIILLLVIVAIVAAVSIGISHFLQ